MNAQDRAPLRVGIVGSTVRGPRLGGDFLRAAPGVEVVALGDLLPEGLEKTRAFLAGLKHPGFKVDDARCFTGLDAGRRVIDAGVDVVALAVPPGFRPASFAAAVEAGKHVMLGKPVGVDPVGVRKVLETGERARAKGLAVACGMPYRHQAGFVETVRRVHEGRIGKVLAARAFYNTGTLWDPERRPGEGDAEWQIRNWYYFDWLSGDHIVEQHINTLDIVNWTLRAHPLRAAGVGGRQARTDPKFGNIYDHFGTDYEYPDGVHVMSQCRQVAGADVRVGATFDGTRGSADPYLAKTTGEEPWTFAAENSLEKAFVATQAAFLESIRAGKPIDETRQVAESTLTAMMGREAAYTGEEVTWEGLLKSDLDLSPPKVGFGAPLPVRPVPTPGRRR